MYGLLTPPDMRTLWLLLKRTLLYEATVIHEENVTLNCDDDDECNTNGTY